MRKRKNIINRTISICLLIVLMTSVIGCKSGDKNNNLADDKNQNLSSNSGDSTNSPTAKVDKPKDSNESKFKYEDLDVSKFDASKFDKKIIFNDGASINCPISYDELKANGYLLYYLDGKVNTDDKVLAPKGYEKVYFTKKIESKPVEVITLEVNNLSDKDATITECISKGWYLTQSDQYQGANLNGIDLCSSDTELSLKAYDSIINTLGNPKIVMLPVEPYTTEDYKSVSFDLIYDYDGFNLVFIFDEIQYKDKPENNVFKYSNWALYTDEEYKDTPMYQKDKAYKVIE